MTEIFAKTPFSVKMTGHKILLVTGHFVVEVNGAAQNIPIDFLGNGHRAFFELRGRLIGLFNPKGPLFQIGTI